MRDSGLPNDLLVTSPNCTFFKMLHFIFSILTLSFGTEVDLNQRTRENRLESETLDLGLVRTDTMIQSWHVGTRNMTWVQP